MRSPKTEFVLFSLAGVAGFLVDASVVWTFTGAGVDPITAQAVAFTVAVTVTWLLNRRFTFARHAGKRKKDKLGFR